MSGAAEGVVDGTEVDMLRGIVSGFAFSCGLAYLNSVPDVGDRLGPVGAAEGDRLGPVGTAEGEVVDAVVGMFGCTIKFICDFMWPIFKLEATYLKSVLGCAALQKA